MRILDPDELRLRAVQQVLPFRESQAELLSGELLQDDHGAATARAWPGGDGGRGGGRRWGAWPRRLRQHLAADGNGLSASPC